MRGNNPFSVLENTLQSRVQPTGNRIMLPNNQMARLGNMAPLTQAYRGAQLRGPVAAMTGAAMSAAPVFSQPMQHQQLGTPGPELKVAQMPPALAMEPAVAAPAIPMPTTRPAAPVQPSSLFDSGAGFTTFNLSDGTTERRTGPRGIRNNNPGNLTGSAAAEERFGAIGRDYENNLVFSTPELGKRAYRKFVFEQNADRKLGEFIHNTYAAPGSQYDTGGNAGYNGFLRGKGFNLDQRIGDMTPPERQALENAMFQLENGVEFGDGTAPTRNEPGRGMSSGDLGVLAEATARGAATAEARIDQGKAKPLSAAERRRFGPENLGMIAFGLSLLGGEDVTTAMNNGLNVYGMFEGMDDAKEQQDAIDAAIGQLPPEQQEYARALYETNPEGFSQLMGQQFAPDGGGGSGLQGAVQKYVEQGLMTPEQAELVALMEQADPEAAVTRAGEIVDESNELFQQDQKFTRNVTESTDKIVAYANKTLNLLREIKPALLEEEANNKGFIQNWAQILGDTGLAIAASDKNPLAGTKAKQLAALLSANQAENAFSRLQQIRDESPTGGALGPVSDREIEFLISAGGNLGFGQGTEALERQLEEIIQRAQNLQQSRLTLFQDQYAARGGNLLPVAKQAAAAPATGEPLYTADDGVTQVLGVE
jgi:hypothetical protein